MVSIKHVNIFIATVALVPSAMHSSCSVCISSQVSSLWMHSWFHPSISSLLQDSCYGSWWETSVSERVTKMLRHGTLLGASTTPLKGATDGWLFRSSSLRHSSPTSTAMVQATSNSCRLPLISGVHGLSLLYAASPSGSTSVSSKKPALISTSKLLSKINRNLPSQLNPKRQHQRMPLLKT